MAIHCCKAYVWARESDPGSHHLRSWRGDRGEISRASAITSSCFRSDVISFHSYSRRALMRMEISSNTAFIFLTSTCTDKREYWRICVAKERKIGAYCWGLVAGKTRNELLWDSWLKAYNRARVWFTMCYALTAHPIVGTDRPVRRLSAGSKPPVLFPPMRDEELEFRRPREHRTRQQFHLRSFSGASPAVAVSSSDLRRLDGRQGRVCRSVRSDESRYQ
jgi:hypothetical protein